MAFRAVPITFKDEEVEDCQQQRGHKRWHDAENAREASQYLHDFSAKLMLSKMHKRQLGTALRQDQRKKVDELRLSEGFGTLPGEPEQNTLPKRQIYYGAPKTVGTAIYSNTYKFEYEGSHCINFVLVECPTLVHCSDTDANLHRASRRSTHTTKHQAQHTCRLHHKSVESPDHPSQSQQDDETWSP